MNVDYIIVGCGLAGISFCQLLKQYNKSFIAIDDRSQQSSTVAGGLYNPVVLKRFTAVWKAKEQLELAMPFYKRIEQELQIQLDYKLPVYRLLASIEEQNNWFSACDKPNLSEFLSPEIIQNKNDCVSANFGFGTVLQTGRIDTATLIKSYREHLKETDQLLETTFNYDALENKSNGISYQNLHAKQIIFAEGFGIKSNPFFNHLALKEVKGELITIHAPKLKIDYVLKASVFLIPLGNDLYRVGATYDWTDKTHAITPQAKKSLVSRLKTFLKCDFNVVDQVAGIRPTVRDRRPLVGQHHRYKNLYVLNGLGTRGVMIGPFVSQQLFNLIEHNEPLDTEVNIKRFN